MSPKWKLTLAAVASGYLTAMSPIFVGDLWTDRTKGLVGLAGVAIAIAAGRPLVCHERSPIALGPFRATPRQRQMHPHVDTVPAGTAEQTELFAELPAFDEEETSASTDRECVANEATPDRLEQLGNVVAAIDRRLDHLSGIVADQSTLMATGLANLRREVARITTLRQVDDAA